MFRSHLAMLSKLFALVISYTNMMPGSTRWGQGQGRGLPTHGPPVVGSGDGVEPLLASRVPYLQLDLLPSQLNSLDLEINPNCGDKCCVESIFRKPKLMLN